MNIILLGPQGSGKGTQAELLVEKLGLDWFEAGKILRSIASSNNEKAGEIKQMMEKGELIPDEYIRLIAWDYINHHAHSSGILFDGYPRGVAQFEALEDMLARFGKKVDKVVYLHISDTEAIKRLGGRVMCSKCGQIYNLLTDDRPADGSTCSKCGGDLVAREDDKPEGVARRLQLFHERTAPILNKARTLGILEEIDGERPIKVIFENIVDRLK